MTARSCALLWVLMLTSAANAIPPQVELAQGPLAVAGARVAPNLLLALSLTDSAAAAAYPGADDYTRAREYAGYFDARMCYSYPVKRQAGSATGSADLSDATGYFSVLKRADAVHECAGQGFSGNFMNWASASTLDIVRYGLSGGDRVIDEPGLTVLQRAYLPDGMPNADFYAHSLYFPRKRVGQGAAANGSTPLQVTPFDTPTLYIVSCRNRILLSNSDQGGTCDTPRTAGKPALPVRSDKFFGEYLARVNVCGGTEGPGRPDLCVPYGSGYKPAGSLQKYAGKMRFGVVGYLSEHAAADPNYYGGALRAALGFVGPSKYDAPGFGASVNLWPEWDGASGALHPGAGVLNYVNLLGRSTPSRSGRYASAAPLSELYYEALRYLQGRQPSFSNAALTSDDNLAVLPKWSDPVTASCQRNLIFTIGNADTASDRYVPGNTQTDRLDAARPVDLFGALAPLDSMSWTRRIGEMETDIVGIYGNLRPRSQLRNLDAQDTGGAGHGSYNVSGLAYWAHTNAIRPDQPVRVDNYVLDLDSGGNGALADSNPRPIKPRNSQLYLAAKYGGFYDRNGDGNPFWSTAAGGVTRTNDNAEWSGDGNDPNQYFLGSDPARLISAIRQTFASAAAQRGILPGLSLMSTGYLFQLDFEQVDWSGSVRRLAVAQDADGQVRIGAPVWDAGLILTGNPEHDPPQAPQPAPQLRTIYTIKADKSNRTIPFRWADLADEQRAWLDRAPGSGQTDGLGQQRLNFLRGERALEESQPGALFRRRSSVLGDAVNSAPVYVGAPSTAHQGAQYQSFFERYKERRPMLYLGANDGMLHGFDAADGHELLAYVPNALMSVLNQLGSTEYRHRPYVDGAAIVAEANLAGQWTTVLVSAMGGGAQGVFALDVTDPDRFERGRGALWEFTDQDDAAIGNVMAAPIVARFKTKVERGVATYRDFAVVASGFNNYADDGKARFVRSGAGALFLLALDKPAAAPWQLGVNYYKLTTPISDPAAANGLGPPVLALNGDGVVRFGYAGDVQGNLWRFDFSGTAPWPGSVGPGADQQPLFVARDGAGLRQPITQQPKLVFAPGGGYLILFGTGKLIEDADSAVANFKPQSFYAIHDALAEPAALVSGRGALAQRTLAGSAAARDGFAVSGADLAGSSRRGWYLDFPHASKSGERSVSNAVLAAGKVFFNTVLPGDDACAAPAVRTYVIDVASGLALDGNGVARSGAVTGQLSTDQVRGAPAVLETAARAGPRNATGQAIVKKKFIAFNLGKNGARSVSGNGAASAGSLSMPAKRMSWREIANWRELHEAAKK